MRNPLDEVEAVDRDARRNLAEMKQKAKAGVDLHRRLHDVHLARPDVISCITGADVDSFESVLAKLEGASPSPHRAEQAFYPGEYEERFRGSYSDLLDRFRKLRDGKSPIG